MRKRYSATKINPSRFAVAKREGGEGSGNNDIAAKYDDAANIISDTYATKTFVNNKAEAWTFTLDDGSTVVKNVLVN